LEWDVTDETMLYMSVSRGSKAGGFDARGNLAKDFEYQDESVWAYELDAKSRLLDFEFDNYENGTCSAIHTVRTGETLCDYSGQRNIFTPECARLHGLHGAAAYNCHPWQ